MSGANTLPQFGEFKSEDGDSPSSKQARAFRGDPAVRDGEAPQTGEPGTNPLADTTPAKRDEEE